MPLRALAVNVIAIYSRSRRKRRTPDSMTPVDSRVERLYSLDELTELRRNVLRYARTFPPGYERNQHLQIAVSLRALFKHEQWAAGSRSGRSLKIRTLRYLNSLGREICRACVHRE
jgi:hypothetical protein